VDLIGITAASLDHGQTGSAGHGSIWEKVLLVWSEDILIYWHSILLFSYL